MHIVKILKRRDAASIVVAVVLAMIVADVLPALTASFAGVLAGVSEGFYYGSGYPGADWRSVYLQPVISALLQLLLVEIGLRIVVALRHNLVRRVK